MKKVIRIQDKIGRILVEQGLISKEQLKIAFKECEQRGYKDKLIKILIEKGFISEEEFVKAFSDKMGIPFVNLKKYKIPDEILEILPLSMIKKYRAVPIERNGNILIVAMEDPTDLNAIADIRFYTNYNIDIAIATPSGIDKVIEELETGEGILEVDDLNLNLEGIDYIEEDEDIDLSSIQEESQKAPIIRFVNYIIADAVRKEASDIHIEPYEKKLRIRYRIDGILHEFFTPPLKLKNAIVSRIKIMSHLDIAERRIPQDGRIKIKLQDNKEIDIRVSTLPTIFGEKVVMRILDKSSLKLDLKTLGFEERELRVFREVINKPYGMILVTGPTGSGKTTTLYSALSELNKPDVNISTAEDPVEYNIEGINQVNIREDIGLTFATALRSFLRQDPDIILLGEIRDLETAEIAVKAALTGHLVLSTLHTNDASSTIVRLVDMGIEPFLVSTSLLLIVAQRLVRKICLNCKEEVKIEKKALISMGVKEEEVDDFRVFKGKGCEECNGTGYKGRTALYEVLKVSQDIKELINKGGTAYQIQQVAIKEGMKTLREAGLLKVKQGITTLEEVGRATIGD